MSEKLKNTIIEALEDLKGVDIKSFFVQDIVAYTDWTITVTGTSSRHNKTLAHKAVEKARLELNIKSIGTEGESEGEWILVDFGDVVLHIMTAEMRDFYQIEQLFV
ncbi:ribosomal silencing factor [Gammaproteobacteria bacterium]|nr:ribosomal silencing factor [Gammaproteobacteria bacterium]